MTHPSADIPATGSREATAAPSAAGVLSGDSLLPERRRWPSGAVARAALIVFAVWFGLQLLWSVSSLVFLVFLATLFGLAVGRGVDKLEKYRIRRGIGSALIVFGTLALIGGGLALSAPTLIEQGRQLQSEVPAAISKVQEWVDSKQRGGAVGALISAISRPAASPTSTTSRPTNTAPVAPAGAVSATPTATQPPAASGAASPGAAATGAASPGATATGATATGATATGAATASRPGQTATRPSDALKQRLAEAATKASGYLFSFVSNTLAALTAFVLLVFLAIYIGAEPDVYRGWLLAAVPATSRAAVREVMSETAKVLRKWLVTQMIAMLAIGSVSTIVLLILGVKAPFALGFIAGLMEFIPTVGPVLSAVPAILMGFVDSPEKAFAVLIAYWGIQFVENNLLIPFLMRGEMDLPPAITLVAQTLMTLLFGFIGLMVAVPLTAAMLVPIRMIAVRENAAERELVRAARRARDAEPSPHVTAEYTVATADRGPSLADLEEYDT